MTGRLLILSRKWAYRNELLHAVPDVTILGVLKIGIERQPQENFQAAFVQLMLEHQEVTARRKEGPLNWPGVWLCLAACTKWTCAKRRPWEGLGGWNFSCQGRVTFASCWVAGHLSLHLHYGARWWCPSLWLLHEGRVVARPGSASHVGQ